jgi:hypothetical protein
MSPHVDRKQIIRDYKARKTPRGIYAVRSASGKVWVGSSMNLDGAKNALWFFLTNGNYKDNALQAEWNTLGEQAFAFEIVEKLSDEVSDLRVRDVLDQRRLHWTTHLGAQAL